METIDTNSAMIIVIYGFLIYAAINSNTHFNQLRRRSLAQDRKLDAILKHLNVDWLADVDPKVLELIRAGRKIEAVKAYKEATGCSLPDAKTYIESYLES